MMKVNWKQLQSNSFLQALHPHTLTEEGLKLKKYDRIVGMSRFVEKIELEVTFDREFLMQYFERTIFQKLKVENWNQIQSLLSEAYKRYKVNRK